MKEEKNRKTITKQRNSKKLVGIIATIVIIIIIISVIFICIKNNEEKNTKNTTEQNITNESYVEEIESGVKLNKSTKLNEAKEVEGLTIANIQLTLDSGITTLLADVTNSSGSKTNAKTVQITLLDYEGNELTTVPGIIKELEVGETTQLNISLTSDYVNAYDFRVKVN